MAKKKRTRKQKELSDLRRQSPTMQPVAQEPQTAPESTPSQPTTSRISYSFSTTRKTQQAHSFDELVSYLPGDLRKTGMVTIGIIIAEIILYFLTKNTM